MSAQYDSSILAESQSDPDHPQFEFTSRKVVSVPDINNGQYSANTIDFDLNSLAANNQFIDWRAAYVSIPLIMTVSGHTTAVTTVIVANPSANPPVVGSTTTTYTNNNQKQLFAASLKSCTANLIHSMSVQLNNNTLIPITPFSNLMVNYKMLHEYSLDDVHNKGSVIGMSKLSPESQSYQSTLPSARGIGSINNKVKEDALFDPDTGYSFLQNKERLERMKRSSFYDKSTENASMMKSTLLNDTMKDGVQVSSDGLVVYQILATIKMDQLHDYFEKVGLIKNSNYRMIFHTNANSSCTLSLTNKLISDVSISSPNKTLPFQVSPIDEGLPVINTTSSIVVKLDVVKSSVTSLGVAKEYKHPQTQCRMYVPLVSMNAELESIYLKDNVKTVLFNDFHVYNSGNLSNIGKNATVNTLLSNGLTRIRRLIVMPFLNAKSNGNKGFGPMESCFCDEPSTLASPYLHIDDFNVTLSNVNVYPQNIKYNFEHFLNEIHSDGSLGAGLNGQMSSGLINQQTFDTYPHLVVNLERKSKSGDDVPQSIGLTFKNASSFTVDYTVIIEYQREVHIDKSTGMIII